MRIAVVVLAALVALPSFAHEIADSRRFQQQALAAYKEKKPAEFLEAMRRAALLRPQHQTLQYQYAIALLCLPENCPDTWTCHCNAIRKRFNEPPPDHPQPTGQLTTAELLAEAEQARAARGARRERRNTEPQFPYPDPNRWTQEE